MTTYKVFATHVFPVRKDVLVLFSDRSARLYGESYDYYPTPCRYPDHELFLWPYFDDNHYLHWSFWDPTRSSVSFTHNKRFGFNCLEYTKIKMSSSKEIFCFIQESEMKIIVVTIYPEKAFEIDKSVHELDTIDCISQGEHTTQILLWPVHEKSVSVLEPIGSKGIGQFSCVQRTLWQNELDLFKLETTCNDKKETAGSLLLAVETTDSEDKFVREYIFAFTYTFDDVYIDKFLLTTSISRFPGSISCSKTAQDLNGLSCFSARFERFGLFFFLEKKKHSNRSKLALKTQSKAVHFLERFFKQDLSGLIKKQ